MNQISIDTFISMMRQEKLLIIDIRDSYKYSNGSIPGAINIPASILIRNPNRYLDRTKKYYIYCQSGHISNDVVNQLNSLGYQTVNILGGYNNYLLTK